MSQDLIIGAANGKVTIEITGQPAIAISPERALELAGELVIYAGTAATQVQTIGEINECHDFQDRAQTIQD